MTCDDGIRRPTLHVLGAGPGGRDPDSAADLLAEADAVFAGPPGPGPDADPEVTALFYAEAWRVERLGPRDAAARLDAWFRAHPGSTAVLAVAGPAERSPAFGAALDGLARMCPDLRVALRHGVSVVPPHRSPLPG